MAQNLIRATTDGKRRPDRMIATSMAAAKPTVTSIQEQVLQGLMSAGGACPYRQLFRVCYGLRWDDMPSVERSRLGVSVRGLEKKGLVEISRRWGNMGYGQPETVSITDTGRTLLAEL